MLPRARKNDLQKTRCVCLAHPFGSLAISCYSYGGESVFAQGGDRGGREGGYGFSAENGTLQVNFPRDNTSDLLPTGEGILVTMLGATENDVIFRGSDRIWVIDRGEGKDNPSENGKQEPP